MAQRNMGRRDFGKLLGVGGLAAAAPSVMTGHVLGTAQPAAADHTSASWRETGKAGSGLWKFNAAMYEFMTERHIPAGALAVVKDGRLVVAKGYTFSDDLAEVEPTSLFRVASLSKPITSAAVCRMAQDGQLGLYDDQVLTNPDLLDLNPLPGESRDPRLDEITINWLLQHRGGWDSSSAHPDDPIPEGVYKDITYRDRYLHDEYGFSLEEGLKREDVIRYGAGRLLHHDPGTTHAYANYGYWLLGEIVAARAGVEHETYIQDNILAPMGISRMRPGMSLKEHQHPDEVPYFSQYRNYTVFDDALDTVDAPYGSFNLENRLASGGWLASAVDYARFTQVFDEGSPVLSDVTRSFVFHRPPEEPAPDPGNVDYWYGYGWYVNEYGNTWHAGSLPGTKTGVTRRNDNVTWVVLFDQRDDVDHDKEDYYYSVISGPLHQVANEVTDWPDVDYFSDYGL